MTAGVEEPNALFTLGPGARQEPNIPATRWSSSKAWWRDRRTPGRRSASTSWRVNRSPRRCSRRASTTRPSWARAAAPGCSTSRSSAAPRGWGSASDNRDPDRYETRMTSAMCWSSAPARPALPPRSRAGRGRCPRDAGRAGFRVRRQRCSPVAQRRARGLASARVTAELRALPNAHATDAHDRLRPLRRQHRRLLERRDALRPIPQGRARQILRTCGRRPSSCHRRHRAAAGVSTATTGPA